jgi:hypothetical protein
MVLALEMNAWMAEMRSDRPPGGRLIDRDAHVAAGAGGRRAAVVAQDTGVGGERDRLAPGQGVVPGAGATWGARRARGVRLLPMVTALGLVDCVTAVPCHTRNLRRVV